MTPDCAFVLDNGQPCRCPARHGDRFCRHHSPEACARRRARAAHPDSDPAEPTDSASAASEEIDPWILRAYWRLHNRYIAAATDPEYLDQTFEMIVGALGNRQISHRCAGRLIAAILDRKNALLLEAQAVALRAIGAQRLRTAHPFEASGNYPVSVPHPAQPGFEAPENYPVSR